MTCIAGYIDDLGNVWMGCDSYYGDNITMNLSKMFYNNGNMLLGYAGISGTHRLLKYKLNIPEKPTHTNDEEYMSTIVVDAIIKCFKDNEYNLAPNEYHERYDGRILIGYKGSLYVIDSSFFVYKCPKYGAIGSGEESALASFFTTKDNDPKEIIKTALGAATRYAAGVAPPFTILKMED